MPFQTHAQMMLPSVKFYSLIHSVMKAIHDVVNTYYHSLFYGEGAEKGYLILHVLLKRCVNTMMCGVESF